MTDHHTDRSPTASLPYLPAATQVRFTVLAMTLLLLLLLLALSFSYQAALLCNIEKLSVLYLIVSDRLEEYQLV